MPVHVDLAIEESDYCYTRLRLDSEDTDGKEAKDCCKLDKCYLTWKYSVMCRLLFLFSFLHLCLKSSHQCLSCVYVVNLRYLIPLVSTNLKCFYED